MEKVKLGEICEIFSGFAIKTFNKNNIGTPVIKIGNITKDGNIELENCEYTDEILNKKFLSKHGDIYIALSGATTGKIGYMKYDNYYINQRVGVVRLMNNNIPQKYIKYYLQNISTKILNDAGGAAQPNISPKTISNYEIIINKNDYMQEIVERLDSVNLIIEKKKEQLSKLDELIKSRFIEMFGDVFYNTNDYEIVKISDTIEYEQPTKYIVETENYNDEYATPVLTAGKSFILGYTNEEDGIFNGSTNNIVIFDDFTTDSKFVDFDFKVKSSAMKILHAKENINIKYFYYALNQNHYEVANHKRHWISVFEEMEYGLPPIELQNEFAAFVEQIDKSKFTLQKSIEESETLLASLMQQYFGE